MFLASLSLANSRNLRLSDDEEDDDKEVAPTQKKNSTASCFQFELLSAEVERPMQTYRAPSLARTDAKPAAK